MAFSTETDELVLTDTLLTDSHHIVLFNDDVNTFDFVIESLIKICRHEPIQAEQCAHIVHFAGKCSVKTGIFDELEPMCVALLDRGLTAAIEELV